MSAVERNGESTLPTLAQLDEVAADIEKLWMKFVPRSSRPLYRGMKERIDTQFERIRRFITASAEPASEGEDDLPLDEPKLVSVLRVVRALEDEEWEQVVIAQRMRRLSDADRRALFDALDAFHCVRCGMECEPEEPHDCAEDDEEGEGDDAEDAAVVSPEAAAAADASPSTPVALDAASDAPLASEAMNPVPDPAGTS